jgi:hypothetical protein
VHRSILEDIYPQKTIPRDLTKGKQQKENPTSLSVSSQVYMYRLLAHNTPKINTYENKSLP